MTRDARTLDADLQPQRILIAIDSQFDDLKQVTALLAFLPDLGPRPAPEVRDPRIDGEAQSSAFIQANISTSPVAASVTIAAMSPWASKRGESVSPCSMSAGLEFCGVVAGMVPSGLNAPICITRFARNRDRNGACMADLDDIYNTRILELAAAIPHTGRLAVPDGHGEAHSKLCGSTISVDIALDPGGAVVTGFAQTVKACLLGQAAAAIVGREIVGTPVTEIRAVGETMRRMLKEHGSAPTGRWSDLALLEPVRDYRHRHASTLLIFDAIDRAVADAQARAAPAVRTAS